MLKNIKNGSLKFSNIDRIFIKELKAAAHNNGLTKHKVA